MPGDALRAQVPAALEVDTFEGQTWVSVVAFRIDPLRTRGVPLSLRFPELNLRTYVTRDGKPGVYFFSLDAASQAAVTGAREWIMPSLPQEPFGAAQHRHWLAMVRREEPEDDTPEAGLLTVAIAEEIYRSARELRFREFEAPQVPRSR